MSAVIKSASPVPYNQFPAIIKNIVRGRAFHIEPEVLHEVVGTVRDGLSHLLNAGIGVK
jgi:hypothetical protein